MINQMTETAGLSPSARIKKNRCGWLVKAALVFHSGDLGDIIYSLLWCWHEFGLIRLSLGPDLDWKLRHQMDEKTFEFLSPLLSSQDWIQSVSFENHCPKEAICLNDFRKTWFGRRRSQNLFEAYAEHFQTGPLPQDQCWLEVDPLILPGHPIVISRSPRYQNYYFPWHTVAERYRGRMAFVGLPSEFEDWNSVHRGAAMYQPVSDALELAKIIQGSQLFIGNQSFPMSLALALGTPLIQETSRQHGDCRFRRSNAVFHTRGALRLPEIP